MNGDIKIGKLLCDEDIITKRQLNKALQKQVKGDKRTLGEILVDLGFCEFDDITNALLNHDSDTQKHEEKQKEIVPEPTPPPVVEVEPEPEPIVEEPKKDEPIEISEEKLIRANKINKNIYLKDTKFKHDYDWDNIIKRYIDIFNSC